MLGNKTKRFLMAQAQRMHALDEAEGLANHRNIRPDVDEDGQVKRSGMQVLYANAVNYLGSHGAQKVLFQEQAMFEASLGEDITAATNIVTFTANYLPLVRRVYKNLFAKSLISIQPMKAQSGYVFWMSKQYASTYAPDDITADDDTADKPGAKAYAISSEKGTIRELNFTLESKLIEAVTQKLAFSWTWESQEKLRSQLGLDLESEMTAELADELAREQDRYIIDKMITGAAYNVNWANLAPVGDVTSADKKEYFRTLYSTAIVNANAYVLDKTYRNCDFAIMNASTYALLQRLEEFKLDNAFTLTPSIGVQKMGVLQGWLTIYVDPGMANSKILMGASSVDWKNTSMIFAPFIPIYFSPQFILGGDFTQLKKGVAAQWWAGVVGRTKDATTSPSLVSVSITQS